MKYGLQEFTQLFGSPSAHRIDMDIRCIIHMSFPELTRLIKDDFYNALKWYYDQIFTP